MDKQEEEQRIFDMAKQDVPFLHHLKLIKHDDRPDFVLQDKNGRKIGLEHFRADVYRVQEENSSHICGGHTVLNNSKDELFQKYHSCAVSDTWTDKSMKQSSDKLCGVIKDSLDMRSHYTYEAFLDNLRVAIHGRPPKVKGHVQKSKKYPERGSYDLMGFLIEVPIPSFNFYFETDESQKISLLYKNSFNPQGYKPIQRRFNGMYSYQKINGLPITKEIWNELDIFEDIDFIIIATYDEKYPTEHHGQYFAKNTPKPHIYPVFSFGLTDVVAIDVQTEHKDDKIDASFTLHKNRSKYDVAITKTTLKAERRKQNRKSRRHFDEATKKFRKR